MHSLSASVVLEAMSVGVPAVAVDYSDIRRILPFPWQVGDRSPEAIVDAVLRAASDRAAVATRQLEWVRHNATIERAADALEAVYRRYVGDMR